MQLTSFRAALACGSVEVKRYGQSFQIVKRKYDADTGAETVPETATVSREEITRQRDEAQKTVDEANAMLGKFDELEGKQVL